MEEGDRMSEVPITFLMRPKKKKNPKGKDPGGPGRPSPSPPGKTFFIFLIVLALLVNLAVVLFYIEYIREAVLEYEDPANIPPNETLWMRQGYLPLVFAGFYVFVLFGIGFSVASVVLLARHSKLDWERLPWYQLVTISVFLGAFASAGVLSFVPVTATTFLAVAACAFVLVWNRRWPLIRREWLSVAYLGTLFVMAIFPGVMKDRTSQAEAARYDRLFERGNIIIEALAEYNKDHGDYPEELNELVPDYLSEIPSTGWARSLDYSYSRDGKVSHHYALTVYLVPDRWVYSRRHLWYWPEQDYDDSDKLEALYITGPRRMDGWLFTYEQVD
jgi:hypothetical protein